MEKLEIVINDPEVAIELSRQVVEEYQNGLDRHTALKKVVLAYQSSQEQLIK